MKEPSGQVITRFREETIIALGTVGAVDIAALVFVISNKTVYEPTSGPIAGEPYLYILSGFLGLSSVCCLFGSLFMIELNAGLARAGRLRHAQFLASMTAYMGLILAAGSVLYLIIPISEPLAGLVGLVFATFLILDIAFFQPVRRLQQLIDSDNQPEAQTTE